MATFPTPQTGINLRFCVLSGQVFRWREEGATLVGTDGPFHYRIENGQVASNAVEDDFRRFIRADDDIEARWAKVAGLAPELEPHMADVQGLTILRPSCPVETLFGFLCSPNNSLHRIMPMVESLASYGVGGRFPEIARLAEIDPDELRAKKFGYRAPNIVGAAQELQARGAERYVDELKQEPYEAQVEHLVSLPGVGRKVADCIALFAFDRTEAAPIDTHVWAGACSLWRPGFLDGSKTPKREAEIRELIMERFGQSAAWAQQLLFSVGVKRRNSTLRA